MAHVHQQIWIIRNKKKKARYLAVNRKSIGTVWINGVAYTYNPDLVYHDEVSVDQIEEDAEKKSNERRRIIIIRRK